MPRCEYAGGCVIEPLVKRQVELENQKRLLKRLAGQRRRETLKILLQSAAIDKEIKGLGKAKRLLIPCKHCLYQMD